MKRPTDPNALRREIVTLEILTNQPAAVLRDVVKYWLFVRDRQIRVESVTLKEKHGMRAFVRCSKRKGGTKR